MWVESTSPIRVKSKRGEVRLLPGHPVELPDEEGQKLLNQAGAKVKVVVVPHLDPLIGSIVACADRRGLVRDMHLADATRWLWVETAASACWTRAVTEGPRCRRCQGTRWWWSTQVTIPCGFSHKWVDPPRDPKTGAARGPGGPADRDHLQECCRHRYRLTSALAILCAVCHPPTPSPDEWSAAWREIAELRQGFSDPVIVAEGLACDAAFSQGDYPAFLRHRERLAAWVGQVVRLNTQDGNR